MRTDLLRPLRLAVAAWALAVAGCGASGRSSLELGSPEARSRLPEDVAALIPEDVVLCLDEAHTDNAYRIWILRRPGGTWLELPARRGRGKDKVESHNMPPSALLGVLRSRLPVLDAGKPTEPRCRYTHWRLPDGAEVQVRELITDRGWFASVERVAM
jgi:hypothetical protein